MAVSAIAVIPSAAFARDFRTEKPDAWTAHKVDEAIKALYGSSSFIESGVKVTAPKVASNGGAIPVGYSADIPVKSIAVFQDANPESAVVVNEVGKYGVADYDIKIKMAKSGTITVVAEGQDGKLYGARLSLEVALGGCEG